MEISKEEINSEKDESERIKRKRKLSDNNGHKEDSAEGADDVNHEVEAIYAPSRKYREIEAIKFGLFHFPDELLYEIFKNLDSWSLRSLMNCCQRFHLLIQDARFWRRINLIKEPLPLGMLEDVLERTHRNTFCIKLRGPPSAQHIDSETQQFTRVLAETFASRCTQLTTLELRGITIDFRRMRILDFPNTLKRLVLNDCSVRMSETVKSIFSGIDSHLTVLEELAIQNSEWFEPYYIMILSKAPALRWLSLKGCRKFTEFVPYGSMAARFGFKKLEYLDLRYTPITDSDLQCFNAVLTLKEIRLSCPKKRSICDSSTSYNCQASPSKASTSAASTSASSSSSTSMKNSEGPSTSSATSELNVTISISPPCLAFRNSSFHYLREGSRLQQHLERALLQDHEYNSEEEQNEEQAQKQVQKQEQLQQAEGDEEEDRNEEDLVEAQEENDQQPQQQRQQHQHQHQQLNESSLSSSTSAGSSSSSSSSSSSLSSSSTSASSLFPPGAGFSGLGRSHVHPHARFLPRADQVIYLDLYNQTRPIIVQAPQRPVNHLDEVIQHPMFWDMINPLGGGRGEATGSRHHRLNLNGGGGGGGIAGGGGGGGGGGAQLVDATVRSCHRLNCFYNNPTHSRLNYRNCISDRGLCSFGRPSNPVDPGVIWIRLGNRPRENTFERLIVRNYRRITNMSLQHLVQCSPNLVYLDLTGTSVTQEGVLEFNALKPECVIVADHLTRGDDRGDGIGGGGDYSDGDDGSDDMSTDTTAGS